MKNSLKLLAAAIGGIALGLSVSNFAVSDVPSNYKVGVVDVRKVVASSKAFNDAKTARTAEVKEFTNLVNKAKTEINAQKDATKKKALEEKYAKELKTKKDSIEKNYSTKLLAIDKNIASAINAKAKSGNYNLILYKSSVLSGGEDLTAEISKAVK